MSLVTIDNSKLVNNTWMPYNDNKSFFSPNIWTPITLEKGDKDSLSTEKEFLEDILIKQLLDNNFTNKKLLNALNNNKISKEILDVIIKEIPELRYQKPQLILRLETTNSKPTKLDIKDLKSLLSKYGNIIDLEYNDISNS